MDKTEVKIEFHCIVWIADRDGIPIELLWGPLSTDFFLLTSIFCLETHYEIDFK